MDGVSASSRSPASRYFGCVPNLSYSKTMSSSEKKPADCTNISSLLFNETQIPVQWSSEVTACFFWTIVYNEILLNITIVMIFVLFAFSLVVNIYLLLGLGHSEALSWNPRYMLLKSLILSDLLVSLSVGPPALYCLLCHETLTFSLRCVAQYFIMTLAILNSLLTVTSMAVERFVYTCHGIHYLRIMTNVLLYGFMIFIWLLALTGAGISTVLVMMGRAKFGHITAGFVCEPEIVQAQLEQSKYFETFNKIFVGSVLFICVLVFLLSYGCMYQEARRVQQPFQQDNARARRTISLYFAIFLLQMFPSTIKLISMFGHDVDNQMYMMILVLVPPCVNPVAYGIRNKEVRQALWRLCGWIKELFCQ